MDLVFLSARIPLTKSISYNARDDSYTTAPYPMVSRVTSHHEQAATFRQFETLLREHAAKGHCLLKGQLDQPLMNASRATHSIDTEQEWVVFDLDKVACAPTFEGALAAINKYLPLCCQNIDCIVQLSASCYNPRTAHLSCHVFMPLAKPVTTQVLKEWFEWINFNGVLTKELRLTDSQMGLHFPLDRTVAAASKLIYIAAPRLIGYTSPIREPIKFFKGKYTALTIPPFENIGGDRVRDKINELRRAGGLKEREYKTVNAHGHEFLVGAEECVVHDIQKSGDTYLRFNLNGGDSLAYFVNLREPHIVGNHKGEPYLYTREIAKDFFKTLTKAAQSLSLSPKSGDGIEPLAFYATNKGSVVHVGYYDRVNDELRLEASTETAAKSWMLSFGVPATGLLPHLDIEFDMTSEVRYEAGYPIVNLYRQTDFIKQYAEPDKPRLNENHHSFAQRCPVLLKTILSALGNSSEATNYFLNWLAYIFQTRQRSNTAWVWHGVQGTGKGMIINHIISPLFGENTVRQVLYSLVDTKFNAYMDGALFVFVDEASLSHSADREDLMSKLKNWITEPTIQVNEKHRTEKKVNNSANFIFASNSIKPVVIENNDRRFNVAEHQATRLIYTPNEYAVLASGEELPAFAEILGLWQVDEARLLTPFAGEAKDRMYEATHTLPERIARAIQEGDIAFFIDARPSDLQLRIDLMGKPLPILQYDQLIKAMIDGTLSVLKREDLYVLFRVVIGNNDRQFPDNNAEQRRMLNKLGLQAGRSEAHHDRRIGKNSHGILAPKWKRDEETLALAAELFSDISTLESRTVVPIGPRKKP